MVKKSVKKHWHAEMKPRAWVYAFQRCQKCGKQVTVSEGVIHHRKYPAGVYEREVEELMAEGICMWLCRDCHREIHIAHTLKESEQPLKSGGYCKLCGKLVYGGWNRAKTLGLDYCICRGCYKKMKARQHQIESGQIELF